MAGGAVDRAAPGHRLPPRCGTGLLRHGLSRASPLADTISGRRRPAHSTSLLRSPASTRPPAPRHDHPFHPSGVTRRRGPGGKSQALVPDRWHQQRGPTEGATDERRSRGPRDARPAPRHRRAADELGRGAARRLSVTRPDHVAPSHGTAGSPLAGPRRLRRRLRRSGGAGGLQPQRRGRPARGGCTRPCRRGRVGLVVPRGEGRPALAGAGPGRAHPPRRGVALHPGEPAVGGTGGPRAGRRRRWARQGRTRPRGPSRRHAGVRRSHRRSGPSSS